MRMSNTITQLKEIATTAPVERAAPMAAVPQGKVEPTAQPHTWDTSAAIEHAASTCWHWQGTEGMAVVLVMEWSWGQAGSRTASPCHCLATRNCPGFAAPLGRVEQRSSSASPPLAGRWGHGVLSPPSCTWKGESHGHHQHK